MVEILRYLDFHHEIYQIVLIEIPHGVSLMHRYYLGRAVNRQPGNRAGTSRIGLSYYTSNSVALGDPHGGD